MRQEIETAPTDGEFVLLEDDADGKYAVARWSPEADHWVEENGKPIQIAATHWYPMPAENPLEADSESSGPYPVERPASWARRRIRFPFFLRRPAPRQPTASEAPAFPGAENTAQDDAIEAQTVWVEAKRVSPMQRRVAALSIIATLVVAALLGVSFGTPDRPAIEQQFVSPSHVAQKAYSVAPDSMLQPRTDADRTRASASDARQAAEPTAPAQQSPEREQRLQTPSDEFAKAQRTINERNLQLRELANELAIARREIENHVAASNKVAGERAQLKQTADSTAARARELASELAMARREIDARGAGKQGGRPGGTDQAGGGKHHGGVATVLATGARQGRDVGAGPRDRAPRARHARGAGAQCKRRSARKSSRPRKAPRRSCNSPCSRSAAGPRHWHRTSRRRAARSTRTRRRRAMRATKPAQIKQAAESTTAELRQSLQQERDKAAALAQDLATARREIDTHAALARDASDEAAQIKQAAESTTAELRQSLQQERDKAEALAQDLATARREIDTHATLARNAGDETAQIKQAAESTTAELQAVLATGARQGRGAGTGSRDGAPRDRHAREHWRAMRATKRHRSSRPRKLPTRSCDSPCNGSATGPRPWHRTSRRRVVETDTHVKLSSKAADETGQIKQVAAELRQSLQQERDRAEALARDLEFARRATDQRIALEPAANGRITQVTKGGGDRCGGATAGRRNARQSGRGEAAGACQRAARPGKYRRSADRARARHRDGQRPGELRARGDV